MLDQRNLLRLDAVNHNVVAPVNHDEHLIDCALRTLRLHLHRAIPFVSDPPCDAHAARRIFRPCPEPHSLYPARKSEMLSHHSSFSRRPQSRGLLTPTSYKTNYTRCCGRVQPFRLLFTVHRTAEPERGCLQFSPLDAIINPIFRNEDNHL